MCWLAQFTTTPCRLRADGKLDRAHLIPQQRMKGEYRSRGYSANAIEHALWDRRVYVPACRRHHDAFDITRTITLLSGDYPPELHEYADEYGWFFVDARTGWVAEAFRTTGNGAVRGTRAAA